MSEDTLRALQTQVDDIYRTESRRVLATLIRILGDFDLAEEALQEAFVAALDRWPRDGIPANPRAWLVSTGRFKAIDNLRRRSRFDELVDTGALAIGNAVEQTTDVDEVEDDRLRLIFTCCHPALSPDAQIALTLREVCGLTTEEIASAFLSTPSTIAQRIVRAKNKIREAKIPFEVPEGPQLAERLDNVLHVIYLVFNEGYAASRGASLTRADLSAEAIRLGRLVVDLLPDPEALGLLALMLLHDARRPARTTPDGELVLLAEQDRALWDRELAEEGKRLVREALLSRRFGRYSIQAAISAVHADAARADETDWAQIVALYNILLYVDDSAVVKLNRAAAIAMWQGPAAGLVLIDELLAGGELDDYATLHAARAELQRKSGALDEARRSFQRALELTSEETQRRFLTARLDSLA